MKAIGSFLSSCFILLSCSTYKQDLKKANTDFTIAFGSCNKQYLNNNLWDDIVSQHPDVWIWGGDIVYADTDDMNKMKADYDKVLQNKDYNKLKESTEILGTWDDHDYGLNDGGADFKAKKESQQVFLDFFGVPKEDKRRFQEGIYFSKTMIIENGSVKIIILDTRYFRSDLTKAKKGSKKRYEYNSNADGTLLGSKQWQWLEQELRTSKADFNVIVSSIQVLSDQHGFEAWGNFPHESARLKQLIVDSKANNVILLSGDRHISEFSKEDIEGLSYPLIDFTSSGLTHVYSDFNGEYNSYRLGEVVPKLSFGLLEFNFKSKEVTMKMIGNRNKIYQQITQHY